MSNWHKADQQFRALRKKMAEIKTEHDEQLDKVEKSLADLLEMAGDDEYEDIAREHDWAVDKLDELHAEMVVLAKQSDKAQLALWGL